MSIRTIIRKQTTVQLREELTAALELCAQIRRADPEKLFKVAADTIAKAEQAGYDSITAQALLYHAEGCHRLGRHDATEVSLRQVEEIYKVEGSLKNTLSVWHIWGLHYLEIGEFLKAYDYLHRTLQWSTGLGDPDVRTNTLNSLGLVFSRIGDYTTSLQFYFDALKVAEEANLYSIIPSILTNIGSLYGLLPDYPKGLEYFERSLSIRTALNDNVGIAITLKNMGTIHRYLHDFQRAIECFEGAREIWSRIGNSKKEAHILASIGLTWADIGELDRALTITQESVDYAQRMHHALEQAFALSKLGEIHQRRKDYDKSLSTLAEALQLARDLGIRDLECTVHTELAQVYEKCGDYHKGLQHWKLAAQIRDEIQGVKTQRAVAQVEIRQALQKAEQEKELLRAQAEEARKEIECRTKELNKITLNLTQRTEMLNKIQEEILPLLQAGEEKTRKSASGIIRQIEAARGEGQTIFQEQFERVYQEFIRGLRLICPDLTATEIRICVLIKMHLSTKQIAELLFTSPLTVKTHRTHIRRKLRLHDGENLSALLFAM